MPAPYSDDLRRKALVAVKRGERKTNVSKMCNISRNTLDLWLKREQETGDVRAIITISRDAAIKLRIGNASVRLSSSMAARRKRN